MKTNIKNILTTALTFTSFLLIGCGPEQQKGPASVAVTDDNALSSTAPNAPVILSPNNLGATNNTGSITISGSCDADHKVTLGGNVVAVDVSSPASSLSQACVANAFSFTINKAVDGLYSFVFKQEKDSVISSSVATFFWILDTVSPSAPIINAPASNPFYASVADTLLSIQGSCESLSTVNLSGDATDSVACVGGAFSFAVNQASGATNSFNFSLSQTDLAGNISGATALQWVRQGIPATPTIVAPVASPQRDQASSVVISGACEDGYLVSLGGADSQSMVCASNAYSFTANKSVDGTYDFTITQTNNINQASAAASQRWIRDTTAPAAPAFTIPGASPYLTASSNVSLEGICEADANVVLSLVPGGAQQSLTCPPVGQYLFPLAVGSDGDFEYSIQQTDLAANTSALVSFHFVRDTAVPATPVISVPSANPYSSNQDILVISGSCVDGLLVELAGDDSQNQVCASSQFSFSVNKPASIGDYVGYGFSIHQISLTGIGSGNATLNWSQDKRDPTGLTLVNPAANPYESSSNTLAIDGACETDAIVSLSGDDAQQVICASNAYAFSVSKASDGTYNFSVNQTDAAGNSDAALAAQWIRNSVAPAAPVILSPAAATSYTAQAVLALSGSCSAGNQVYLYQNGDSNAIASMACDVGNNFSFSISAGGNGSYAMSVAQQHADLMSAADSRTIVIDDVAPDAIIDTGPAAIINTSSASVSFHASEAASFECKLDNGSWAACVSGANFSSLSSGSHNISVRATDLAGNVSNDATVSFIVDLTAPDTTIDTGPASRIDTTSTSLTFHASETSTFECKLDSGSYAACVSGVTFSSLASGAHVIYVRAVDQAGNVDATPASKSFTAGPVASFSSTPASSTGSSSANFAWTIAGTWTSMQCKLDSQSFRSCDDDSGSSFDDSNSGIANGSHSFQVKVTNSATGLNNTTSYTWTKH